MPRRSKILLYCEENVQTTGIGLIIVRQGTAQFNSTKYIKVYLATWVHKQLSDSPSYGEPKIRFVKIEL